MKTIAEAAAELVAAERHVLCLDTCIFLDVITTGNRGQTNILYTHLKLLETLRKSPEKVTLVVNELVLLEWDQRIEEVRGEASKWLIDTDKQIQEIHRAWEELGKPLASLPPKYHDPQLVEELTNLAKSLLGKAMILKEDTECMMRAIERVKTKKRPSQNKEIKDSIHLEHYLELSRKLQFARHGKQRLFVSTNSSDFWENRKTPERPHSDLVTDMNAAGLTFLGKLPIALSRLGIIGLGSR